MPHVCPSLADVGRRDRFKFTEAGVMVLEQFPPLCLWGGGTGGGQYHVSLRLGAAQARCRSLESQTSKLVWGTPILYGENIPFVWATRRLHL